MTREQVLKGWETRRKNGTEHNNGTLKACETKRKNGIGHEAALKAWETRRKNGTDHTGALKGWETKRKNGTEHNNGKYIDGRSQKIKDWKHQIWLNHNGVCAKVGCNRTKLDMVMDSHHILSRKERPDLLYDEGNGCLLCHGHHNGYHRIYGPNGSRETLTEYLWNMKSAN